MWILKIIRLSFHIMSNKISMKTNLCIVITLLFVLISGNCYSNKDILVKGGTFVTKRDKNDEKWKNKTVVVKDFYIDKYEVTVAEFAEFIAKTGYVTWAEKPNHRCVVYGGKEKGNVNWRCNASGNIRPKSEHDRPVLFLTPMDALNYAIWCGKRLPTEDEWEYAARGGVKSKDTRFAGSNILKNVAHYDENSSIDVFPIASLLPNELGLYDMFGNVYEMCSDFRILSGTKVTIVKGLSFIDCIERFSYHHYFFTVFDSSPTFRTGFRCVKSIN